LACIGQDERKKGRHLEKKLSIRKKRKEYNNNNKNDSHK